MKKFITLLILLCTVIGAKAALSVTTQDDGTVLIKTDNEGDLSKYLTSNDETLLKNATKMKFEGPIGKYSIEHQYYTESGNDFEKLRDIGTKPVSVDFSDAMITQSILKCVYKSDNGDYYPAQEQEGEFSDFVEYTSSDASFPPIINQNGVDYKLFYATTTDDCRLPEAWASSLTTLSLPNNANYKIVNNDFCNGFKKLSSVTIPDNVKVIGKNAFRDCFALQSIDLNNVEFLCEWCFYDAAMPQITIPGTCVYIGSYAFTDQQNEGVVTTLVFNKPPANDPNPDPNHYMIIKKEAFNNMQNLRDVYINSTSKYICENWAFSRDLTFGQGNPTANLCSLHFSSEVAEHYSNLKHPLTVNIAKDPAKFHNWLMDHYDLAQEGTNSNGNGWWEFVSTGTIEPDDPPVEGGKVLRTYSDYDYDRIVPRGMKAYIVTGLKALDDGNYEVSLTQLMVIPKRTGVILYGEANSFNQNGKPIISLQPVEIANGFPLRRDYWYKLTDDDAEYLKNYLWPSCVANDDKDPNCIAEEWYNTYNITVDPDGDEVIAPFDDGALIHQKYRKVLAKMTEPSTVDPCDNKTDFTNDDFLDSDDEGYNIEKLNGFYRNFYMTRYSNTDPGTGTSGDNDFVGFFRAKHSSIKSGYAYLRLKGGTLGDNDRVIITADTEHNNSKGVEVIVKADNQPYKIDDVDQGYQSYQVEYNQNNGSPEGPGQSGLWNKTNPNLIWENPSNWGVRPSDMGVLVKFFGEPIIEEDGHATMIIGPVQDNNAKDPYFYTIQGVRIAKPTAPGIYIHNGKKVVIK